MLVLLVIMVVGCAALAVVAGVDIGCNGYIAGPSGEIR